MVTLDGYAERHPWLTDAGIVIAVLGSGILGVHMIGPGDSPAQVPWVADVVTALACLALLKARAHPRTTVVVTAICAIVSGSLGYILTPLLLAPLMVALYWLAVMTTSRTAWRYGGMATVLVVATAIGVNFDETVALRTLGPALWLVLPLVTGSRSRLSDAYLDAVQARAEHAERTREEEARRRVIEERMRIARDLHDVVAHHMAVANAQAGTAAHLLESNPELTQKLLGDLQATTSSVMLELRDTVGVLRHGSTTEDSLEPTPGLARLPALLEACRSAGLTIALDRDGEPRELPSGIDLTAYRIIQEALTNATKYAATRSASLRLAYGSTRLTITVTNETLGGTGRTEPHGYGVIGMRERAQAVGGDLHVSQRTDRFEVVASLPLRLRSRTSIAPAPQETTP